MLLLKLLLKAVLLPVILALTVVGSCVVSVIPILSI